MCTEYPWIRIPVHQRILVKLQSKVLRLEVDFVLPLSQEEQETFLGPKDFLGLKSFDGSNKLLDPLFFRQEIFSGTKCFFYFEPKTFLGPKTSCRSKIYFGTLIFQTQ